MWKALGEALPVKHDEVGEDTGVYKLPGPNQYDFVPRLIDTSGHLLTLVSPTDDCGGTGPVSLR